MFQNYMTQLRLCALFTGTFELLLHTAAGAPGEKANTTCHDANKKQLLRCVFCIGNKNYLADASDLKSCFVGKVKYSNVVKCGNTQIIGRR